MDHARIQMSGFTIFHIFEKKGKKKERERELLNGIILEKINFIVFAIKYDIFAIK